MDWNVLDNKLKKKLDREYVSCDEAYELNTVYEFIMEQFPNTNVEDLKRAIASCCKSVEAPHPRSDFLKCVLNLLKIR